MDNSTTVCGRTFTPQLIQHLNNMLIEQPHISHATLAREVCERLHWCSPKGQLCLSSAKVALHKLQDLKLIQLPEAKSLPATPHRLRASGQPLPGIEKVPCRVDQVRNLQLHLISGADDSLHSLWNDLIIQQHPCGNAPLVGAQMRYLIGSEHGWLGALGFGPATFCLSARDCWIGWSTNARLRHLQEVVGLSRFLIRQEVHCTNLASKVLSLALSRLTDDWQTRYGIRPLLVETFVDRSRFTGHCFSAASWMRLGTSMGRGRLGPQTPSKTPKDIWVRTLCSDARQQLQKELPKPVTPCSLQESLEVGNWCAHEMDGLDLGDVRLNNRAEAILAERWKDPTASFSASFPDWGQAKRRIRPYRTETFGDQHGKSSQTAYGSHYRKDVCRAIGLAAAGHKQPELQRIARNQWPRFHQPSRKSGLFLHSLLAYRPDGIPLGVLEAKAWGVQRSIRTTPEHATLSLLMRRKACAGWRL